MSDARFNELSGLLLDGEPSSDELNELADLVKEDEHRAQELQSQLEVAELIALSEDELRDSTLFVSAIRSRTAGDPFVMQVGNQIREKRRWSSTLLVTSWAVAAVATLALIVSSLLSPAPQEPSVFAQITAAEGFVRWTGEGGEVMEVSEVGFPISGGTLETVSPNAGATVLFTDGTQVTLSGSTTLVLSEKRQKVLNLRKGALMASVATQPSEQPMVIHTSSAVLSVLGTKLSVVADASFTRLQVHEGRVRMRRNSDDRELDVLTNDMALARIDDQLDWQVTSIEEITDSWKADLAEDGIAGKWVSLLEDVRAKLKIAEMNGEITEDEARRILYDYESQENGAGSLYALPARISAFEDEVAYIACISVSRGEGATPILLGEGSMLRIYGHVNAPTDVTLGIATHNLDSNSTSKYSTETTVQEKFTIDTMLSDLQNHKDVSSDSHIGRALDSIFVYTGSSGAKLAITGAELIGPNN